MALRNLLKRLPSAFQSLDRRAAQAIRRLRKPGPASPHVEEDLNFRKEFDADHSKHGEYDPINETGLYSDGSSVYSNVGENADPQALKMPSSPKRKNKRRIRSSGRGISGDYIFITGKKATGPNELSGGRAKPTRRKAG